MWIWLCNYVAAQWQTTNDAVLVPFILIGAFLGITNDWITLVEKLPPYYSLSIFTELTLTIWADNICIVTHSKSLSLCARLEYTGCSVHTVYLMWSAVLVLGEVNHLGVKCRWHAVKHFHNTGSSYSNCLGIHCREFLNLDKQLIACEFAVYKIDICLNSKTYLWNKLLDCHCLLPLYVS